MQCCGQAALYPQWTALACAVCPQLFQQPCESICLHFSVSPSTLMTQEPMGQLQGQEAREVDKILLQMGKRDTVTQSEKLWKQFLLKREVS